MPNLTGFPKEPSKFTPNAVQIESGVLHSDLSFSPPDCLDSQDLTQDVGDGATFWS